MSTVRSTIKHVKFDRAHCLGFLSNWRRFNVVITRARSLLIVIENPHIVCKDQYWNKLLWYCVDNGSYKGCFLPPDRKELFDENAAQVEYGEPSNKLEWEQPSEEVKQTWQPDESTGWSGDYWP